MKKIEINMKSTRKFFSQVIIMFLAVLMIVGVTPNFMPSSSITVYAASNPTSVAGGWRWPLDNVRVTTAFGTFSQNQYNIRRTGTPIHRGNHLGYDIVGSNNVVRAATAGVVHDVGVSWVTIRTRMQNGQYVFHFYDHLYNGVNVSRGNSVSAGQHIGNIRGHLHFAIVTDLGFSGRIFGWGTRFTGNSTTQTLNGARATYHSPRYVISNNRLPGSVGVTPPPPQHSVTISSNRTTGTTADRFDFTARTNFNATRVTLTFAGGQTFNMNRGANNVWTLNGNTLRAESNRLVSIRAYDGNRHVASASMRVTVTQPQQQNNVWNVWAPNAGGINLRASASTNAQILASIPHGARITITQTSGGWGLTNWNGRTGWVYMSNLRR